MTQEIWEEYWLDQEINDRGIEIDMILADSAVNLDEVSKNEINEQLKKLTGLENPNSVLQMRSWLSQHGLEVESLGKAAVKELVNKRMMTS